MKRKRNAVPLTRVGGYWVLRPRLEVIENGERKTVQRAIKLITADGRSKRPSQDVLDRWSPALADHGTNCGGSTVKIGRFTFIDSPPC